MRWMDKLGMRARSFFHKTAVEGDLEQEVRYHVERETQARIAAGMDPVEARRAALMEFGGVENFKEECRDARRVSFAENLVQDLHYAGRVLRRSSGLTATAVLTIALGIGLNTTVFSIVDSVLLRPLPVENPQQITVLAAGAGVASFLSYADYRDLVDQSRNVFSGVLGYRLSFDGLSTKRQADRVMTCYVTSNYFSMLGLKPYAGRLISPDEGQAPGADPVLVLSYAYWKAQFGGDLSIVGREASVNGHPVTIIGIAPKGFHGLTSFAETQAYLPISMSVIQTFYSSDYRTDRSAKTLGMLARLLPGTSVPRAQAALNVIAQRLSEQDPKDDSGLKLTIYPERLARPIPIPGNPFVIVAALFLALAGMVLLLACMNVANILLVRATARQREMAVRSALGGTRSRLVRQMLTESLLLAMLGGAAGILLGIWGSAAIASVHLQLGVPVLLDFGFDWRVFAYAFAAALGTGIVVGIVPAIRASRLDLEAILHEGARTAAPRQQRLRAALIAAQVAGSLMLLIMAGLFSRSLGRVQSVDLGFDPSHLLNMSMDPHEIGYKDAQSREFYKELLARVRATPGVESAALAFTVPMRYYTMDSSPLQIEGYMAPKGEAAPVVYFNQVSPGYFDLMRTPIVSGRAFTSSDDENARHVAVINQAMAQRFWPNQNPIGRQIGLSISPKDEYEIIGVARDSKTLSIFGAMEPYFYLPLAQSFTSYETLQVRTYEPPESMVSALRGEISQLAPRLPVFDVATMQDFLVAGPLLTFRFGAVLAAAMGLLGLLLAVVGVYGVASYAASQRTREIGIRMALGARPIEILRLIFKNGAVVIGAGLLAGLVVSMAVSRIAARFLLVSSMDAPTYLFVTAVLAAAAFAAYYVPARRAMQVDPVTALRHE